MRPALAVLGVFLSASTALAYVAEVDISEVAYIYNEQDEFRVLFKFDDLQIPDSFIVDFAAIIIPVSEVSSEIPIEVYAVSRDWSASSVKWDYPWQQAGADFSDTCLTRWIIHPGVGYPGHYIVVTEYIQRIVKGHQDCGLVIKPPDEGQSGFSEDVQSVFSGLGDLKLRILYRGKD